MLCGQLGRALTLWAICFGNGAVVAQTPTGAVINREYAIKAAFLYQFLNYVDWPADSFAEDARHSLSACTTQIPSITS